MAFFWALCQLPRRARLFIARLIGRLFYQMDGLSVRQARANLRYCLGDSYTEKDVRHFCLRIWEGLIETILVHFRSRRYILSLIRSVKGEELLREQHEQAGNLIVFLAHSSDVHLISIFWGHFVSRPAAVMKVSRNDIFRWMTPRALKKLGVIPLDVRHPKNAIRHLRQGGSLLYLPDWPNPRAKNLPTEFFGQPSQTLDAPRRLSNMSGARAVWLSIKRDPKGYHLNFEAMPEWQARLSPEAAAKAIARRVEAAVREDITHWLWDYPRFTLTPEPRP